MTDSNKRELTRQEKKIKLGDKWRGRKGKKSARRSILKFGIQKKYLPDSWRAKVFPEGLEWHDAGWWEKEDHRDHEFRKMTRAIWRGKCDYRRVKIDESGELLILDTDIVDSGKK